MTGNGKKEADGDDRKARLAEELRANLLRRKAQARARRNAQPDAAADEPEDDAGRH